MTIRHRFANEKISKRELAKQLGVSRRTVDRALAAETAPKYERRPAGSSFDAFEKDVRPEYAPADPADRLVHEPGKTVQCDLWFPHQGLPLGYGQEGKPPVLVMTSAYSGFVQARMIPSRTTEDLLGGMWELIQEAEAVPARLLWDNETGIGRGKLTEAASAFAGVSGTEIKLLPPRDPESKGMVERMNGFFRRGFMPGRDFIDPHDFNDQLIAWLPRANARYTRSRGGTPADLVAADRAAMRPLGPIAPDAVFRKEVRLPRDYYVFSELE
ncbi:HTH domain-containing protein [Arthrobacter dokdonensis]|uniref:HTH domain-containing protein n=1 Tax=Arthrobacter dokdonellae TaxID=2211210 RepID=UPI001D131632|nr:HTH domain-containing protein [Arthrobacter dokdonellae]